MGPAAAADMPESQTQPPPAYQSQKVIDPDAKHWEKVYAMFTHCTIVLAGAIPVVPPLIMWAIKKDESPFIDDHGREAVNFQITLVIYGLALIPIGIVTCSAGWWVGWPVLVGLSIVGTILAAVAAYRGRYFRYPACIRFIKDRQAF